MAGSHPQWIGNLRAVTSATSFAEWFTSGPSTTQSANRLLELAPVPLTVPGLAPTDAFRFVSRGQKIHGANAEAGCAVKPYAVPNPYVGSASFEPQRFAVSGRGERRLEFRALPAGSTVRIYTVRGELVQTIRQNGSPEGYVAWNLRTKDNLDVAAGLYIYHVDAPGVGTYIGKFAVVK